MLPCQRFYNYQIYLSDLLPPSGWSAGCNWTPPGGICTRWKLPLCSFSSVGLWRWLPFRLKMTWLSMAYRNNNTVLQFTYLRYRTVQRVYEGHCWLARMGNLRHKPCNLGTGSAPWYLFTKIKRKHFFFKFYCRVILLHFLLYYSKIKENKKVKTQWTRNVVYASQQHPVPQKISNRIVNNRTIKNAILSKICDWFNQRMLSRISGYVWKRIFENPYQNYAQDSHLKIVEWPKSIIPEYSLGGFGHVTKLSHHRRHILNYKGGWNSTVVGYKDIYPGSWKHANGLVHSYALSFLPHLPDETMAKVRKKTKTWG